MESSIQQQFLEKYKSIHEPFTRYCSSRAFGLMAAEDLVQEAVLAALEQFEQIRDKEKLLSYLIGTVQNILKNKYRRKKFQGPWDENRLQQIEDKAPSPEVAMDIKILLEAIDQLSEKQREAILLFEISGFSIREISVLQESTEAATKTRLSRARQHLRIKLNEHPKQPKLSAALSAFASILF